MQNLQGFPSNFKLITCKIYIFFHCNVYMLPKVRNYRDCRYTCNPHNIYVHITGNILRHRDSLHFLWGKHLQCTTSAIPENIEIQITNYLAPFRSCNNAAISQFFPFLFRFRRWGQTWHINDLKHSAGDTAPPLLMLCY